MTAASIAALIAGEQPVQLIRNAVQACLIRRAGQVQQRGEGGEQEQDRNCDKTIQEKKGKSNQMYISLKKKKKNFKEQHCQNVNSSMCVQKTAVMSKIW